MSDLTRDQIVELVRIECAATSRKAFAERADVSLPHLSDVLLNRRAPGGSILAALGYQKIEVYRKQGVKG